jgi:hypothetical protein
VFGMGTGVPSLLLPPVRLHIQAVSLDKMYTTRLPPFCQVLLRANFKTRSKTMIDLSKK